MLGLDLLPCSRAAIGVVENPETMLIEESARKIPSSVVDQFLEGPTVIGKQRSKLLQVGAT